MKRHNKPTKEAEDDYKKGHKTKKTQKDQKESTTQQEVVQLQSLDKNTTTEAKWQQKTQNPPQRKKKTIKDQ